jgi:hypothetical protein
MKFLIGALFVLNLFFVGYYFLEISPKIINSRENAPEFQAFESGEVDGSIVFEGGEAFSGSSPENPSPGPSTLDDCSSVFVDEDGIPGGRRRCLTTKEHGAGRTGALSECASKSIEIISDERNASAMRSVDDYEKLREITMRACMESRGYEY